VSLAEVKKKKQVHVRKKKHKVDFMAVNLIVPASSLPSAVPREIFLILLPHSCSNGVPPLLQSGLLASATLTERLVFFLRWIGLVFAGLCSYFGLGFHETVGHSIVIDYDIVKYCKRKHQIPLSLYAVFKWMDQDKEALLPSSKGMFDYVPKH
jgi:hypothetical protein